MIPVFQIKKQTFIFIMYSKELIFVIGLLYVCPFKNIKIFEHEHSPWCENKGANYISSLNVNSLLYISIVIMKMILQTIYS